VRIVQVCSAIDDFRGGAEQFCFKLSRSLKQSGYQITLLTGTHIRDLSNTLPITVKTTHTSSNRFARKLCLDYFNPRAIYELKKIISEFDPNVVHFHSFYGISTSLVSIATQHCPVVITVHDSWLAYIDTVIVTPRFELANAYYKVIPGLVHRYINRRLTKNAVLVSPSIWMKDYLASLDYNIPIHINNGIEPTNRKSCYQNIIIWVGTLTTFKGLPSVIASLSHSAEQNNWRFIVIGDGPHKTNLETRYPNVEFVGYVDPDIYYKQASLLVVSSIGLDNFPTVILEGMRRGICVVGRNKGGIPEMIQHGSSGMLYDTTTALVNIVTSLMNNESEIRRIGETAFQTFNELFTWESCFRKYLQLYAQMTSDS